MRVKIITKNGNLKTYHPLEDFKDYKDIRRFLVWKGVVDLREIYIKETARNLEDYWSFKFQDRVDLIIFDSDVSYEVVKFDEDREPRSIHRIKHIRQ